MLIATLILICMNLFLTLLILGELFLIKGIKRRPSLEKTVSRMPVVSKEIIITVSREMKKAIDRELVLNQYAKWIGGLTVENPILAIYIQSLDKETDTVIGCLALYQILKAQLEADSLENLTKIKR